MSHTITSGDSTLHFWDEKPTLPDEIFDEVKTQLLKKVSIMFGGNIIDPSVAVALYANSIDGCGRISKAHSRKDGEDNNNPNNFGNVYEEQEVSAFNRAQIKAGSTLRAERTDNLADMDKAGALHSESLKASAVKHHQHVDMVHYDEMDGQVSKTVQVKHTRGSNILAKEAYTSSENAPDIILVPTDMEARHAEKLHTISQRAHTEDNKQQAETAKNKLEGGLVDSIFTENPDRENHPFLHDLFKTNKTLAKAAPYVHEGLNVASDATMRVSGNLAKEAAIIVVGGALFEIKDACVNPHQMSFFERLQRLFAVSIDKVREGIKEKGGRELCLEAINGLLGILTNMFKNLKALFQTFANAIHQVWHQVWDFVTGKIRSFSDLISGILKVFCATGIAACAFMAEEYLAKQFPWVPSVVLGLLAVAVSGVAIVFANRAIDLVVGTLVGFFSEASAARLHREQVEKYISDNLPKLLEDSEKIAKYANEFFENRHKMHVQTFEEIKKTFHSDCNVFRDNINAHAKVLGTAGISENFLDDLEAELCDFATKKHGV